MSWTGLSLSGLFLDGSLDYSTDVCWHVMLCHTGSFCVALFVFYVPRCFIRAVLCCFFCFIRAVLCCYICVVLYVCVVLFYTCCFVLYVCAVLFYMCVL